MPYTQISVVNITLQSSGITGLGFGVPLFATAHLNTFNRVEAFTDLESVATTFGTDSNAYRAAQGFFASTPSPSIIKIGRISSTTDLELAPEDTTVTLNFSYRRTSDNTVQSFPLTLSGVDGATLAADLSAALNGNVELSDIVSVSASGEVVSITPILDGRFRIDSTSASLSYQPTAESPGDLIAEFDGEDSDYYFVTAEDHSDSFISAMSAAIESSGTPRIYFTSKGTAEEAEGTGVFSALALAGVDRTATFFHQDADTVFPETYFAGYNAPFDAGSVTWNNLQLSLTPSRNTEGKMLSTSQKIVLANNNVSFMEYIGKSVLRGGRVASGELIETIRGRDAMTNDIKIAMTNLLISQQGGKLPYTNEGVGAILNVVTAVLDKYVRRNFINQGYTTDFLSADRVPTIDKQNNIYQSGKFTAELTGAIHSSVISGSLVLDLNI